MLAILTVCKGARQSRIPHTGCAFLQIDEFSTVEHTFEFRADSR